MRNYLAPEYKNEKVMSNDVITDSVIEYDANYKGTGVSKTVTSHYTKDPVTGEKTNETQSVSFGYSVSKLF